MSRLLRLGLTLSQEDAKVFWQSEENYKVTSANKEAFKKAKDIYLKHPIVF